MVPGSAYRRHRHDTYAIGVTETGLQAFAYRGATHRSVPGNVVVLHPDEAHDGRAGSEAGFGYRQLYVEPSLILAALRDQRGEGAALPFAREPVTVNETLAGAIRGAFEGLADPLAGTSWCCGWRKGCSRLIPKSVARQPLAPRCRRRRASPAIARRGDIPRGAFGRVGGGERVNAVRSGAAVSRVVGASPYRYSVMRRLEAARSQIGRQAPLVDAALNVGFADQAHFTRMFTARYGITPGRYRELRGRGG